MITSDQTSNEQYFLMSSNIWWNKLWSLVIKYLVKNIFNIVKYLVKRIMITSDQISSENIFNVVKYLVTWIMITSDQISTVRSVILAKIQLLRELFDTKNKTVNYSTKPLIMLNLMKTWNAWLLKRELNWREKKRHAKIIGVKMTDLTVVKNIFNVIKYFVNEIMITSDQTLSIAHRKVITSRKRCHAQTTLWM